MTHPHAPPDPSPHDGAFLRSFFGVLAVLLLLLATLGLLVDPLGHFGTGLLPPVVSTDRDQKAAMYRRLPTPPELVVLGSSRSKTLAPSCLTGSDPVPGFNFAVNGAASEDLVAVLGFLRAQPGARVRTLVVGVDPEMFSGSGGMARGLAASRALARFAPHPAAGGNGVERLGADLLGWQSVAAALRSVTHRPERDSLPEVRLEADGRQRYLRAEAALGRDSTALAGAVRSSIPGILAIYESFAALDRERVGYLRQFAATAHEAGISVVAFLPPVHPAFARAAEGTAWRVRTEETVALLKRLEGDGLLRYVETRDLLRSSGDTLAYVDAIHFLGPAAATLAAALRGAPGRCALQ